MRETVSKLAHWTAWLAVILTVSITVFWFAVIADGNYCWSAFVFWVMSIPLGCGALLLAVLPSSILYFQNGNRRDLKSLWLAGVSVVILIGEAVLLNIIPMRGE